MKTVLITSHEASEALFPLFDDDIATVAREDQMAAEIAEIDALIEEAERGWAAAEQVETFRLSRELTDQVRARRTARRAAQRALRSLPVRLDAVTGEAA
ncbi:MULTISPECIES: hypothetical protein [Amycolatopsis]|uniref:hypothetical protein n=1 Tax=Amycolatopsis TaxID=1813 RepID=UPI000B8B4B56|nr:MULTISPECIES: hypothetical protein [Amycolatopsis]OXM70731.1 hypothetical protein CF166_20545 [Amycolatopsis sp. KNN50.9b]